ncbi:hypothetical protein ElyMa_000123000 [Elysia marginata]|uniref:Uncharacterized protein n=1 Tax=Elysia marginata TaxID=1093978 RepID=A0AAV4EMP0_9GAST|nr:hypothetical protein ElyMa_000123000 [Elysia marginata]
MLSRDFQFLAIFALVASCGSQQGGVSIPSNPISCADPKFGPGGPSHYTRRNARSCCYEAATRALCCLRVCSSTSRALGGTQAPQVQRCDFPGVANITTLDGSGVTCNAVLVNAKVNGVMKRTFLTTEVCKNRADNLGKKLRMDIMIGGRLFPAISFEGISVVVVVEVVVVAVVVEVVVVVVVEVVVVVVVVVVVTVVAVVVV